MMKSKGHHSMSLDKWKITKHFLTSLVFIVMSLDRLLRKFAQVSSHLGYLQ